MSKRYQELSEEEKASRSVAADSSDGSLVYCTACHRAMEQGDCEVPEDIEIKLRCAYDDCVLSDNIALQSLFGWDEYRLEYKDETEHWPDTPAIGECYTPAGDDTPQA